LSQSLSHEIFEYLFVYGFVGSRYLKRADLEKHYQDWGILDLDERIILYAQEFPNEAASDDALPEAS